MPETREVSIALVVSVFFCVIAAYAVLSSLFSKVYGAIKRKLRAACATEQEKKFRAQAASTQLGALHGSGIGNAASTQLGALHGSGIGNAAYGGDATARVRESLAELKRVAEEMKDEPVKDRIVENEDDPDYDDFIADYRLHVDMGRKIKSTMDDGGWIVLTLSDVEYRIPQHIYCRAIERS